MTTNRRWRTWRIAVLAIIVGSTAAVPALAGTDVAPRVPHYLVFGGTYGFRHDGIPEAAARIRLMGDLSGAYTVEYTEDAAVFGPALYDRVDGIVLIHNTGLGGSNSPFSESQKTDFLRFFECGGALVAVHAAADSGGQWPAYDDLIGAAFDFHPHFSLEARENPLGANFFNPKLLAEVSVLVEDQQHVTTAPWHGLEEFRIVDELYRWTDDPRPHVQVLLSLDERTHYFPRAINISGLASIPVPEQIPNPVQLVPPLAYPHHSPLAWTKSYGAGRVFYTNLGHSMATWDRADFQSHVFNGIKWAAEQAPDRGCMGLPS
jgi:uncharacterized protein